MKNLFKVHLFVVLIIVVLGIYIIFKLLFPVGYELLDPQPNFLITILQGSGDESLGIILEADLIHGCHDQYDLRATSVVTDTDILVKIGGLYKKKEGLLNSCRPAGWRRPLISLDGGLIKLGSNKKLIFTISDNKIGDRMNKYIISRDNDKLSIEPRQGGFTTIIAYKGTEGLEKYSEKYDYKLYSSEQEQFQGILYFTY